MIIFSSAKEKRLISFPELRDISMNYYSQKRQSRTAQENEPKDTQFSLNKWS